jgi:hypothetical protein
VAHAHARSRHAHECGTTRRSDGPVSGRGRRSSASAAPWTGDLLLYRRSEAVSRSWDTASGLRWS